MAKTRGRPRKMTRPTIQKLEDAFLKGLSDREACLYAGIAPSTLYDYCKANPDFSERKELLKEQVKMNAKINIANKIEQGNIDLSQWYLARKEPEEFGNQQKIEHSGSMDINARYAEMSDLELEELAKRYEAVNQQD
ncbi:hypothetical protein JH67_02970 [Listeria monocytogenes]|nr:hypothetical protein [Listeria monocytogenes]